MSARCVPPRGAAQHQPRGCAAHSSSSVRTTRLITRLITRLLLRFELPGGYFGTTRPIIRLVVDLIIRLVVYYQPKADNPADNPAVSFVVLCRPTMSQICASSFVTRRLRRNGCATSSNPRAPSSSGGMVSRSRSTLPSHRPPPRPTSAATRSRCSSEYSRASSGSNLEEETELGGETGGKLRHTILTGFNSEAIMSAVRALWR